MRESWTITHEGDMTRCESSLQVTYLKGRITDRNEAIRRAREWQPGNGPEASKKKANKGAHMRKYWEYRKNGGTLGMKEYFSSDE